MDITIKASEVLFQNLSDRAAREADRIMAPEKTPYTHDKPAFDTKWNTVYAEEIDRICHALGLRTMTYQAVEKVAAAEAQNEVTPTLRLIDGGAE